MVRLLLPRFPIPLSMVSMRFGTQSLFGEHGWVRACCWRVGNYRRSYHHTVVPVRIGCGVRTTAVQPAMIIPQSIVLCDFGRAENGGGEVVASRSEGCVIIGGCAKHLNRASVPNKKQKKELKKELKTNEVMSVDLQKTQQTNVPNMESREGTVSRFSPLARLRTAWSNIQWSNVQWKLILPIALIMATGWCVLFLMNNWLQFLAGLVPVLAGMYLGRRVKEPVALQGILLGVTGFGFGLLLCSLYAIVGAMGIAPMPMQALSETETIILTPAQLVVFYVQFSLFAIIPFPAFGTVIAYRNENRRCEMKEQVDQRGGQLERAGTIRTLEDLQGLSLPQFGTYVRNIYNKQNFLLKDYRFLDKDRHLDLQMEYEGETYLLRLSVADEVRPGTIETLVQDMKKQNIAKGGVVTSTHFTPEAQKSGKNRKNVVLIDGQTLFDIAEQ